MNLYYRARVKKTVSRDRIERTKEIWRQHVEVNARYDGHIVFLPRGGLGNRLQVMAAALNFAERHHRQMHFYWRIGNDLAAPFDRLFDFELPWVDEPEAYSPFFVTLKKAARIAGRFGFPPTVIRPLGDGRNFNVYSNRRDFPQRRPFPAADFYQLLQPSSAVLGRTRSFFPPSSGRKRLGIHIRFTDTGLKHRSDWVLNRAASLVRRFPEHEVLVVSDNQNVKNGVMNLIHEPRLLQQATTLVSEVKKLSRDRGTVAGMEIAAADLFALSQCDVLWSNKPQSTYFLTALLIPRVEDFYSFYKVPVGHRPTATATPASAGTPGRRSGTEPG